MIQISESAQDHFRRLLAQQGSSDTGVHLRVTDAGTPSAQCALEFCELDELNGSEWAVECEGFVLYVDANSTTWLDQAEIDYKPSATGGELNIAAPNIRGKTPGADASIVARVQHVLDNEINPQLASHGGRVSLHEIDAAGVVTLQFGGGCHGCGMADVTLKQGVEKTLRARVAEITAVRDVTDHAEGANPYYRGNGNGSGTSAMA